MQKTSRSRFLKMSTAVAQNVASFIFFLFMPRLERNFRTQFLHAFDVRVSYHLSHPYGCLQQEGNCRTDLPLPVRVPMTNMRVPRPLHTPSRPSSARILTGVLLDPAICFPGSTAQGANKREQPQLSLRVYMPKVKQDIGASTVNPSTGKRASSRSIRSTSRP